MRVLFVTSELDYSNTSAAQRNRILVQGLSSLTTVDVIEIKQFDNAEKLHDSCIFYSRYASLSLGLNYSAHSNKQSYGFKNILKKIIKSFIPDKFTLFNLNLDVIQPLDEYDYIISTSDPKGIHFSVVRALNNSSGTNAKYIQYWGDPWFDDVSRKTNAFTKYLESWLLSKTDYIVYNSVNTLSRQKKLFFKHSQKMYFLPRGITQTASNLGETRNVSVNDISLMYAGDYKPAYRDLSNLATVCSNLNLNLDIYGQGCLPNFHGSEFVKENGRRPQSEIISLSDNYTYHIVLLNSSGGQVPGKLYDLLPTKHRVILILDGSFTLDDIPCSNRFIIAENTVSSLTSVLKAEINRNESSCIDYNGVNELHINNLVANFLGNISESTRVL